MKIFFTNICILFSMLAGAQNLLLAPHADTFKMEIQYRWFTDYSSPNAYGTAHRVQCYLGKQFTYGIYEIKDSAAHLDDLKLKVKGTMGNDELEQEVIEHSKAQPSWQELNYHRILRPNNAVFFYNYKQAIDEGFWLPDTTHYQWQLVDSFKTILGYPCQKAVSRKKPTLVSAWFSEQIPFNAGPLQLSGLPGLIMEYQNVENRVFIMAVSVSNVVKPAKLFAHFAYGKITTKEAYDKYRLEEYQRSLKVMERLKSGSTISGQQQD